MRRLRQFLVYAAPWAAVALGFAISLALTERMTWPQALVAGTLSTLPAALLGLGVMALCRRVPLPRSGRAVFLLLHVIAASTYSAIWSGAIITQIWFAVGGKELDAFLSKGLAWQLVTGMIVYFVIAGICYARGALARAELSARDAERAETLRLRAELSALRARLDPHFLFNVLQTLGALMTEQPQHAHTALEHLAALLKRRIDAGASQEDVVPLSEELADARQYLTLEQLRFGARLQAHEDIEAPTLDYMIPKFTLQPLVENAIHHGLAPQAAGGRVTIGSRMSGSNWTLSVTDDGHGADPGAFVGNSGVGISVLRERLRLRFGESARLDVRTAIGEGCSIRVSLPIEA